MPFQAIPYYRCCVYPDLCGHYFGATTPIAAAGPRPPERYKNVLHDRLDAMTNASVNHGAITQAIFRILRIHRSTIRIGPPSHWKRSVGSANTLGWYRAWIEIPSTVGGKDIRGARVHLAACAYLHLRESSLTARWWHRETAIYCCRFLSPKRPFPANAFSSRKHKPNDWRSARF